MPRFSALRRTGKLPAMIGNVLPRALLDAVIDELALSVPQHEEP